MFRDDKPLFENCAVGLVFDPSQRICAWADEALRPGCMVRCQCGVQGRCHLTLYQNTGSYRGEAFKAGLRVRSGLRMNRIRSYSQVKKNPGPKLLSKNVYFNVEIKAFLTSYYCYKQLWLIKSYILAGGFAGL